MDEGNFNASDAIYQNHAFEFVPHSFKVCFRYFDSLTNDLIIAIEWERLPTIYHRYVARKRSWISIFRTSWFTHSNYLEDGLISNWQKRIYDHFWIKIEKLTGSISLRNNGQKIFELKSRQTKISLILVNSEKLHQKLSSTIAKQPAIFLPFVTIYKKKKLIFQLFFFWLSIRRCY